jgi:cytosine/adenosine deaminase-related metal-dependent hydrolase
LKFPDATICLKKSQGLRPNAESRITIGLASDVAAGPELNPWEVMKAASYGQNLRSCYIKNAKTLSPTDD